MNPVAVKQVLEVKVLVFVASLHLFEAQAQIYFDSMASALMEVQVACTVISAQAGAVQVVPHLHPKPLQKVESVIPVQVIRDWAVHVVVQ